MGFICTFKHSVVLNFSDKYVKCRYKSVGIRLDSGDLAYLSGEARKIFQIIEKEFGLPGFGKTNITASNDLNEETLDALNKQVLSLTKISLNNLFDYQVDNASLIHSSAHLLMRDNTFSSQGHEVDCYGIGTYLVTCYAQAALGCVFKLVEINNQPRIKLSEDVSKVLTWQPRSFNSVLLHYITHFLFLSLIFLFTF